MKVLHIIAWVLLIIGGLNWGLVGIGGFVGSDWNVVHMILGAWPPVEWIVYILVGLSALWLLIKKVTMKKSMSGSMPAAM